AAWRFRHRNALGKPDASLNEVAQQAGLSPRYLTTVWTFLQEPWPASGPVGKLQALWRELPSDAMKHDEARRSCEHMRDLVVTLRREYRTRILKMQVRGISPGSQPFVLWQNRQLAAQRMRYAGNAPAPDLEEFCRVFPDAFFITERPPYFDTKESLR